VLVCVCAVGCADDPAEPQRPDFAEAAGAGGEEATTHAANAPIEGFWATYANEMDATVVELHADGDRVSGRGCLSGWQEPSTNDALNQCGELSGSIAGNQVSFAFNFGGPGPWDTYAVDAQMLEGGVRMNGTHSYYTGGSSPPQPDDAKSNVSTGPATVFRPPQRDVNDPQWPFETVPVEVGTALARTPNVTFLGTKNAGKFTPATSYRLETIWGGIRGELGVFAPVDLKYEHLAAGVVVVHAGPIAQPEPDSPIALEIEIHDGQLTSLKATPPSGEELSFAPSADGR
jgi:hypothetical protein